MGRFWTITSCLFLLGKTVAQDEVNTTVIEVLAEDNTYASLLSAIETAGLTETLSGPGPFTLFAPSNSALALVPNDYFGTISNDPKYSLHLQAFLKFHVTQEGTLLASDLTNGRTLQMLYNATTVTVGSNSGVVSLSTADGRSQAVINEFDMFASNGVVHGMLGALLPPFAYNDLIDTAGIFFRQLCVTAGIDAMLRSGEFTILLPTSDAFVGIPSDVLSDASQLTRILQYHVLNGIIPSTSLASGVYPTLQGSPIRVQVNEDDGTIRINGVLVIQPDILARNGIIHSMDGVIPFFEDVPTQEPGPTVVPISSPTGAPSTSMPIGPTPGQTVPSVAPILPTLPPTQAPTGSGPSIGTLIAQDEGLSTLASLIELTNLMQSAQRVSPLTVFAPINDAFQQLQGDIQKWQQPEYALHLQNLLLLHGTSSGVYRQSDLANNITTLTMLNNEQVSVTVGDAGSIFVNGPDDHPGVVIESDLEAWNGVLHKIDSVLFPFFVDNDLINVATKSIQNVDFVSLIVTAGLDEELRSNQYTLLAPTNEAIAMIDATLLDYIQQPENVNKLVELIEYHMLQGLHPVGLLNTGTMQTADGRNVVVKLSDAGGIQFNDANVLESHPASNGILYVLDKVNLPTDATLSPTPPPTDPPTDPPTTERDDPTSGATLPLHRWRAFVVAALGFAMFDLEI